MVNITADKICLKIGEIMIKENIANKTKIMIMFVSFENLTFIG